jgi:transposase InsO family protein
MGITALYQKPRTTRPGKGSGHRIYPYLLRDVEVSKPNQAWASDITFIPMAAGFAYLVAIMDLYSRKILSWRLSNTQMPGSALTPCMRLWSVTGSLRSSTPIRVVNSPATPSLAF